MPMEGARIDVHCHAVPPVYREAIAVGRAASFVRVPDWTPEGMLEVMDRHGIGAALPSISVPGTDFDSPMGAQALARRCNEYLAENTVRWPDRFGGFATLPLPNIDAACQEIEHALDVLRLDGVCLFTSYGAHHLGDPALDPVLATLDARHAAVFVHPTAHPSAFEVALSLPPFALEYPFDTTRAAVSLILSGALDRFPNIKFILSHAGGALPFLSWRVSTLSERLLARPPLVDKYVWPLLREDFGPATAEAIMIRIRRFWFDIANAAGAQVLHSLETVADPERILFGSDWPYVPEAVISDTVHDLDAAIPSDDKRRMAIGQTNAARLFPRLRAPDTP